MCIPVVVGVLVFDCFMRVLRVFLVLLFGLALRFVVRVILR
jgi:hypothetical protein